MMLYTLGMAVLAGVGMGKWGEREKAKKSEAGISIANFQSSISGFLPVLLLILIACDLLLAARALPHTQTTAPQAVYDLRTAPAFLLSNPDRQTLEPAASGRFLSMSTITFDPGDMGDYRRILLDSGQLSGQLDGRGFDQLVIAQKSQEILAPNLPLLWRVAGGGWF